MHTIAVIGSGTMGRGIAQVFSQHAYAVKLIDHSKLALDKAKQNITTSLDRLHAKGKITEKTKQLTILGITYFTDIQDGLENTDLVIEAVTESKPIKFELFKKLSAYCSEKTILATNTSSISITQLAAATRNPESVIGMHFMNPVPIMSLVEVIRAHTTSDSVLQTVCDIVKKIGKIPVIAEDYPGFIANRILMPMLNEAIEALFHGIAGVQEIDTVMKLGMAHPMGPLQLADFIGLDVCVSILKVLYDGFKNPKYAPCPLLCKLVDAGKLGVKTKEGFYKYTAGGKILSVSQNF